KRSKVLLAIMYCVTGELPAAHGCRPTDTMSGLRVCARTIAGAAKVSDAAPTAVMKRRRDARLFSFSMVISSSSVKRLSDGRAVRLVTDQAPDVLAQRLKLRMGTRCVVARARQWHVDHRLEAPRVRRHHRDPIGGKHGLVDCMRNEHDRSPVVGGTILSPDAQQFLLQ